MRSRLTSICFLATALLAAQLPPPPVAPKIPVTETIHGVTITDNYRWLEDQNSPQTRAWIAAEQKYTAEFFASLADRRNVIRASLERLERVETVTVPVAANGLYFFSRRLPSEEQASIFVRHGLSGNDQLLVNPNTLFPDHSASVLIGDVSSDGRILAYQLRKGGQDETELHFLDTSSKKELPDVFPRARYGLMPGHSFTAGNTAIYYTFTGAAGPRVRLHRFGTPVSSDQEIFGSAYGPGYSASCGVTSTSKYLFCRSEKGSAGVEGDLYVQKLNGQGTLQPIAQHMQALLATALYRDHLFVLTSSEAANRRVLDIDFDEPSQKNWKERVPQGATPITGISVAANKLFVISIENVSEQCRAFSPDGTSLGEIKLPPNGSITEVRGAEQGTEAFVQFSSFSYPPTIFRLANNGTPGVWWQPSVPIALDSIAVQQVWYPSKDGTKIPMFIVSKKGTPQADRPTLLTGYGGFNLVQTPRWSPTVAWWVEQGGVYAIPALRGGGEFGEAWHRAGMFEKKQNVFDDFIGAAEYLIRSGITSRERLAIFGTSNGGLLVGAAMTERPDLFRAVVCGAPLLDMVRYQRFKIAKSWVPEYGSSEDPAQFQYILKYSPYQHVEKGVKYPAVLFWTGDSDTRVDPLHARKMTAEMQAEAAPGRPILIRYDTLTGHSGGRSVDQQLDFDADFMTFVKSQIG